MGPEDVARAAAVLGPAAPFPMAGGEPVFAEPWEGRAFAMAVDVVERTGLPWRAFQERLVAAITDEPQRAYYESWVVALEGLVLDAGAVTADDLARERSAAASYRYHAEGVGDVEVFPVRVADELPAVLATLDLVAPFDTAACRHAERYRTWHDGSPGPWRFRAFDASDAVLIDVPVPNSF